MPGVHRNDVTFLSLQAVHDACHRYRSIRGKVYTRLDRLEGNCVVRQEDERDYYAIITPRFLASEVKRHLGRCDFFFGLDPVYGFFSPLESNFLSFISNILFQIFLDYVNYYV